MTMFNYSLKLGSFQDIVEECSDSLKRPGSFLLLPTETVYGLACSWNDKAARQRIYEAKARPEDKPFQMLASDIEMVKSSGGIISPLTEKIVEAFCPGAITIVVPSKNGQTIGFRIPKHDFVLELIKSYGQPLAATSANISGSPSALSPEQATSELKLMPDVVVDNGTISADALHSTVIKVDGKKLQILREGAISLKEIRTICC